MEIEFHPMTEFPPREDGEEFSKTVVVYDGRSSLVASGFYNYDWQSWSVFTDLEMELVCWSYRPNPDDWLRNNPHVGSIIVNEK
jgi:hypothetical protein